MSLWWLIKRWWCEHIPTQRCLDCGKRICDTEWVVNFGSCDECFTKGYTAVIVAPHMTEKQIEQFRKEWEDQGSSSKVSPMNAPGWDEGTDCELQGWR